MPFSPPPLSCNRMDYESKARDLVARGDKKLRGFSLFGGSSKYEEAAELYEKASNQFKLAKLCELGDAFCSAPATLGTQFLSCVGTEAGETYIKLAEAHTKLESKHDTASAWVEAAKAFLKCDQRSEFGRSQLKCQHAGCPLQPKTTAAISDPRAAHPLLLQRL